MGWIKGRIVGSGSKLDRTRELLESSRWAEGRGGGGWRRASEATGPDIGPVLSLSPPPPPTRLSGVFPPFCSSLHGVAFSRWASNRNRDPPKPPRLLLARLLAPPLALIRSFSSSPHTLFSTRHDLVARSFAFFPLVFFELSILSMKIVRERMQFLHRIETKGDCHEDCH